MEFGFYGEFPDGPPDFSKVVVEGNFDLGLFVPVPNNSEYSNFCETMMTFYTII